MNEESPPMPATESETKLTSDQFDEFNEALEVLYLIANISGRNYFTKNWPQAAAYLFGEQLIHFDEEGAIDEAEREKRAELEVQAEERRLALLETLDGIEEKSVQSGVLQTEHVKGVVEELGRELALHVYSVQIVDRFIPPPPKPKTEESEEAQTGEGAATAAAEAVPEIQPIDVGAVPSSPISEPVQPEQASTEIAPPPPVPTEPAVSGPISTVSEAPAITPVVPEPTIQPPVQKEASPKQTPVHAPPSAPSPPPPPQQPVAPPVESAPPVPPPALETPEISPEAQENQEDTPNTQRAVSMKFVSSKQDEEEKNSDAKKPPEGS